MALPVSPPPLSTNPLDFDEKSKRHTTFASAWQQTFTNWWTALRTPANTVAAPPTSASVAIGGQLAYDQNFLYVAVNKNLWKRIPLQAF